MKTGLSISQVSRRTGLSAHTLRYYERIGLITPIDRAAGGQRRYAEGDMDWLDFLLRLRTTGMSIQGMQAFARLRRAGNATVRDRRELLEAHLAKVEAHLQALTQAAEVVRAKITLYGHMERSLTQPSKCEGTSHDPGKPL